LIPIVLQVAARIRPTVEIFGDDYPTRDGTCVRDYIHVIDLARAHVMALDVIEERNAIYNLGCGGQGYTVKEVIQCARDITEADISIKICPRRDGDPAVLIASSEIIRREMGWSPQYQDLESIVRSAWKWFQEHPKGYQSQSY
jgi:UDP-glucose 4-epimerase